MKKARAYRRAAGRRPDQRRRATQLASFEADFSHFSLSERRPRRPKKKRGARAFSTGFTSSHCSLARTLAAHVWRTEARKMRTTKTNDFEHSNCFIGSIDHEELKMVAHQAARWHSVAGVLGKFALVSFLVIGGLLLPLRFVRDIFPCNAARFCNFSGGHAGLLEALAILSANNRAQSLQTEENK